MGNAAQRRELATNRLVIAGGECGDQRDTLGADSVTGNGRGRQRSLLAPDGGLTMFGDLLDPYSMKDLLYVQCLQLVIITLVLIWKG